MKVSLTILIVCISLAHLSAQNLFIFDKKTGEPIPDVFMYNDEKTVTAVTNQLGIANLDEFDKNDRLHFQHSSYNLATLSILSLGKIKYRLGLTQKMVDLFEVVVSANKWEANSEEIPNKIEVIKKKEIIFENPATSADMLATSGQVYVQKSQLGGGSPMLRGFSANKILFVVDGVRMNNIIYRSGNLHNVLQADVNSLEEAEIIFGPGTNIYGSDALGGVIDLHTLKPETGLTEKWNTSGSAMARLASADFEKTLHADLNFSNNKWSMLASVSYSDFDDLVMGSMHNDYVKRPEYVSRINGRDSIVKNDNPNKQLFSGYDQLSFLAKIKQQFSKHIDWTFSFYLTRTGDVPRYDRLIQYSGDELKYAEWYYQPQQWLMNSLILNFTKKTKIYNHASFTFAYQNLKEGRNDRNYQDDWLRKRDESVNIFSANADFDKVFNWQNYLYYGIEFIYNMADSRGIKENILDGQSETISSRYPDGGNESILAGAYASYKKNYEDKPLTLQAGMRFSYSYLFSRFDDTSSYKLPYETIRLSNGALTGSAGLTYRPGKWQLKLNLSSGFRAPNLDDVAKIFDSEPGKVVVPNENLKPEYLYNIDAGVIWGSREKVMVQFTAFYSYLVNAIVRRDYQLNGMDSLWYDGHLSQVEAMVNTGSATIYGASLGFDWKILEYLRFNSMLTYIKGEDDEGYAMRHAPPLYGSTTLSFEQSSFRVALSGVYNAEVAHENLAPTESDKTFLYATDENGNTYSPAWWTLNLKASYAFYQDKFTITVGVDNILDYRYRAYSSGIAGPGRNFIAAFLYRF